MASNWEAQCQNPPSKFRGAPFWAWNCKLDKELMTREVDYFKEMGLGGFHMHCRTGMDTPYLSDEFMDIVRAVVQKAEKENMLAWLYDEDRWPSGFAGGLVTKDEQYRSRYLVFTPVNQDTRHDNSQILTSGMSTMSSGHGTLLARFDVKLEDGFLKGYRRLKDGEDGENVWYAYMEISLPSPWWNNYTYLDTLNPKAVERFVEVTHERYKEAVGDYFGTVIPAIFTDEPQFAHKTTLGFAGEKKEVILPYTDDIPDSYQEQYGEDFFDTLPELFWELPDGKISVARYRYHDHIAERFSSAFADTVGGWCKRNGLELTGHLMEEPTLESQTHALGEAMRSYRNFQRPGIDILCDNREYSTAKQCQSAVHQYGYAGMTSELYGVTNWDFDFRGHKLQGDWQAALGVTTRVHHLSWTSMAGEAKRDYPASIFYQSPWYKEYPLIEDHFARVNTALTSGKPDVKIGVIHPIESYWLYWGPKEQTAAKRQQMEQQFSQIIEWLLFGLQDFDFIAESLLPSQQPELMEGKTFDVGEMAYDVVIVPGCVTLRSTTVQRLQAFVEAGGQVIFMGEPAKYMDAVPSTVPAQIAAQAARIPFDRTALMEMLEPVRQLDIRTESGARSNRYIYQMRTDAEGKWLFIANGKKAEKPDRPLVNQIHILLNGVYTLEEYDTLRGTHRTAAVGYENGKTELIRDLYEHDSLLLRLEPVTKAADCPAPAPAKSQWTRLEKVWGPTPVTLSEPNVLLLDMAEYSLDQEAWHDTEEVLRIDNILRARLGYPLKMEAFAQPWSVEKTRTPEHSLRLRFHFDAKVAVDKAQLALETPELCTITFNGKPVSNTPVGYFTDMFIKTVELGAIQKGDNTLLLEMPYMQESNLEWCYVLGDFGVEARGARAWVTEPVRSLDFSDWTHQGLPFYGANVTYEWTVDVEDGEYAVEIDKFRAPVIAVAVDGKDAGRIALLPYRVELGHLSAGRHTISIKVFGNRFGSFGQLHCSMDTVYWCGPGAWRTKDAEYSYEYQFRRTGLLMAPVLLKKSI